MGITNFPNGISSFGAPVVPGGPITTGNVFFVDSGSTATADTSDHGVNPTQPFATIDFAVGRCTANNGDVIYVMPGHSETVSAAGGLDLDVAGITVFGIGNGPDQPTVTLDTIATADVDVDAAGITVHNIHFVANIVDVLVAIDVNATDFTLSSCRFTDSSVVLNAIIWVTDALAAASDRITIENCKVDAYGTANTHFINFTGTGVGHIIRNNILMGDWATMAIGGAGIVDKCLIDNNRILNVVVTADTCINVGATAEGLITNNLCAGGHATDGIVNGDMGALENYYEDQDTDLSGIIEPAIT